MAKDVAAALFPFLDQLPNSSTEISAVMSELFAINSQLRDLRTGLLSRHHRRNAPFILADVELALPSLSQTLSDVERLFGRIFITQDRGKQAYARVWREICLVFQHGPATLLARLEMYRVFFVELSIILRGFAAAPLFPVLLAIHSWKLMNVDCRQAHATCELYAGR